ncbi:transcriptional regulator [Salmonella enterica]|uniref:Transcriptional regulator n=1 Tax=Salmonella enterica I TaxID=59201 RepID=A0A702LFE7_SALET|nr:PapB/FocB family fimbrial expression transcriptional regulator [Salmonella enterica]EBG5323085.1 transcriptional regulator [Salmonella enterica subsp. enterica serovar Fresno]EBV2307609.1 transcriptional regulator [Salmonella enterica subsp. enterica serovar Reading]ECI4209147.1 transcriptional regulator [Salmonella enterica subsp. enterica]EDX9403891.1 transcriptional regulator [Salmonella enterica subsp. enterica serovar Nottingham]EHE7525193.1 transcriptional regulator [Salmonella enteri
MSDSKVECSYRKNLGFLLPGQVHIEHFRLLADISHINSERILLALELFLVKGLTRQQACNMAGISQSCLSVKVRQMQDISRTVMQLYPWYNKG